MFKMEFLIEGAAFEPDASMEVARILATLTSRVLKGDTQGVIYCVNGNRIGTWDLAVDEESSPAVLVGGAA